MKTYINCVVFEFNPVCPECGERVGSDDSVESIKMTVSDMMEGGFPCCEICLEPLIIRSGCEVLA